MRTRDRRLGLARLIAATAALALILANVVGAYAHTHAHAYGTGALHVDCNQHHDASGGSATSSADPAQLGHMDDSDGKKLDHAASCDFVCHGGVAILPASVIASGQAQSSEQPGASHGLNLRLAASLERPPRFSVSA